MNSGASEAAIKPVSLVENLGEGLVRCKVCEVRCEVAPAKSGTCKMRTNQEGQLKTKNFGVISKADLEFIEQKKLFHFFPGTKIFSLGGFGQNFPTLKSGDQFSELPTQNLRILPPEKIVKFSIEHHCRGVVFGYNEPTMWYEYLYDALRLVKANGMYTAILTNGYLTQEALDQIGHYIDGVLLEVNAFSEQSFKALTGQSQFQRVLETATRFQRKYKIHVEIQTTLVPGVNDSPSEMRTIAAWIRQVLGEFTPWHLISTGDTESLVLTKAMAEDQGLHYVYLHDVELPPVVLTVGGEPMMNTDNTAGGHTFCHKCHRLLISRTPYETRSTGLEKDRCSSCGSETGVHSTIWKL
jgi:pyruvate formate lyase activating enzyme